MEWYSTGLFSNDYKLDIIYYSSLVVGISAAAFTMRFTFQHIKNISSTARLGLIKLLRKSLEDFCWLMPLAGILYALVTALSSVDSFKSALGMILITPIFVLIYIWPLALTALLSKIFYKKILKHFNNLVPNYIEFALCFLLLIAIIAQELYVHTIYNS